MPTRENQTVVRMSGWSDGLNKEVDTILLRANESPDVSNIDFGLRGEAIRRNGFTKWSTSDPAGMSKGEHLYNFNEYTGGSWLIYRDTDGDVWHVDSDPISGTLVQSQYAGPTDVTATTLNQGAQMNDKFYLTSGGSGSAKANSWDGTTWVNISDNTLNGSGTEFPLAVALINHNDRLWAGSVGTTLNSLLHYSDGAAPETWQTNSFFDVAPDSGHIRGLAEFGDSLLIFKDFSIHVFIFYKC